MQPIIEVHNVSKQYRLGKVGTGSLHHDINRWWHRVRGKEDPYLRIGETNQRETKGESDYVWALRDINFTVQPGEVLGIIGRNGAGKSTLLKILSRITAPTTGSITLRGRVASLLEVGTGMHPELTGRENIYLNGAILGMRRKEIDHKLDAIVDFAGVERYLNTPVKRYSSGMHVRLGFAVAAHLEPDILIVDEVLAVGDVEFQKKCLGKMQDVSREEGRTVLFVSHNLAAVQNICQTGLLMENGKLPFSGAIEEVVEKYLQNSAPVKNTTDWAPFTYSDKITVQDIWFSRHDGERISTFLMQEDLQVNLTLLVMEEIEGLKVNIRVNDKNGLNLVAWRTEETMDGTLNIPKGKANIHLKVSGLNLVNGVYFMAISMHEGGSRLFFAEHAMAFELVPAKLSFRTKAIIKNRNLIYTPCKWVFNYLSHE